jgi:hypothetical protein
MAIDKLGVETEKTKEELKKEGAEGDGCPECGTPVLGENTNVPCCPVCGTKPFEKRDDPKYN